MEHEADDVFTLIERMTEKMRQMGWNDQRIGDALREAQSSDFAHLARVARRFVRVYL